MVEPWLRETLRELDAVRRGVLHALELAREDAARWAEPLGEEQLNARPVGLPSVGFQMRHTVRSLDRLLTYAEGRALTEAQLGHLRSEQEFATREALLAEFAAGMATAMERVRGFVPEEYEAERFVGRDRLETTAGALLIHCAEHTQRHCGQMVTTAKVVMGLSQGVPVQT